MDLPRGTGVGISSRIKGQARLRERLARQREKLERDLKAMRLTTLALARYARGRARREDAHVWAAAVREPQLLALESLEGAIRHTQAAIDVPHTHEPYYVTRPVRKRKAVQAELSL